MVEVAGEYEFAAPQELVWESLFDPEILFKTIAGCERLDRVDDNTLLGRLNIRVGPVQGVFQGKVESSNIHAPSSLRMTISGNGPAGVIHGEGDITLEALPTSTRLSYDGSVQVSGRIATVGQRLMDSSAKSIVKQSLQNLDAQIQAKLQPQMDPDIRVGATVVAAAPPVSPGQTEFMVNVAKDVIQDLIPAGGPRWILVGAGLTVVALGLVNAFANLVARRVARIMKED